MRDKRIPYRRTGIATGVIAAITGLSFSWFHAFWNTRIVILLITICIEMYAAFRMNKMLCDIIAEAEKEDD